jgi:hypothetical protein
MSNFYNDKFEFYKKKKTSADPEISFNDNRIEIIPGKTGNWVYLLWSLIIFGPLIYWLVERESTTILVLSMVWIIALGYELCNEVMDDNKVYVDLRSKTIRIEPKWRDATVIDFDEIESLKIKHKSFGRFVPSGKRIQIKKSKGGHETIATISDSLLGDKIGNVLRELMGLMA